MATKYNIDIIKLVDSLLPFGMRSPSVKALAQAAFSVYRKQSAMRFENDRIGDSFQIKHNGQVCYLRAALNSKFKSNLKGVYFEIGEISGELEWLYSSTETLASGHIYAADESKDIQPDIYAPNEVLMNNRNAFVIYVPSDLFHEPIISKIKQFVNDYRLVTRTPQYVETN